MKIAIVVQGRFYAFDLARELIRSGVDVTVLTNYPKRIVRRFGVPEAHVRSCLRHGLLSRALRSPDLARRFEPWLHRWFSRWAARALQAESCASVQSFSGVAEELFRALAGGPTVKLLVRGSSHIETQANLLAQEALRAGQPMDRPSPWMIAREQREYEAADAIFLLSSFARDSFLSHGVPAEKLVLLPLGSDVERFRPSPEGLAARCRRVRSGEPLRVLTVGSFAYRKGALDLVSMARACQDWCVFRFVGPRLAETSGLWDRAKGVIDFIPKQPERELPPFYEWAEVFVFPTIEDGYALVLAHAQAAGLPILATTNCAASDLLKENETGWVLPVRQPQAFVERLRWCHAHRPEFAAMIEHTGAQFKARDWSHVAQDFLVQHAALLRRGARGMNSKRSQDQSRTESCGKSG
jgi:glycosyltransferase involved in cell wall biosynthesis